MKVTTKGQVTIPLHIRRFLGISSHSEVDFTIKDDSVVLVKIETDAEQTKPASRIARLRGIKKGQLNSDQWLDATRGD